MCRMERAGTTGATQHASTGSEILQVTWEHQRERLQRAPRRQQEKGLQAAPE